MATEFKTGVGKGKYLLQFETDNKEYYLLMQATARRCVDGEPRTQADCVRAMSDEDLAKRLLTVNGYGVYCKGTPECDDLEDIPEEMCLRCMLNWLRALVQEGEKCNG